MTKLSNKQMAKLEKVVKELQEVQATPWTIALCVIMEYEKIINKQGR